jgi:hypothetical protein
VFRRVEHEARIRKVAALVALVALGGPARCHAPSTRRWSPAGAVAPHGERRAGAHGSRSAKKIISWV